VGVGVGSTLVGGGYGMDEATGFGFGSPGGGYACPVDGCVSNAFSVIVSIRISTPNVPSETAILEYFIIVFIGNSSFYDSQVEKNR